MRRALVALTVAAVLSVAVVAPATADKPVRGCADSFDLWAIAAFRAWMFSPDFVSGLPQEGRDIASDVQLFIANDAWLLGAGAIDKNGDEHFCAKQGPPNKGHLWGWIFNVVDNTANQPEPA